MELNQIMDQIMSAAIVVHKALGPGLLELANEECLCHELKERCVSFERQSLLINFNVPLLKDGIRRRIL